MKHLRRNLLLSVASIVLGSSLMNYKAYAQNQNTVQPVQGLAVFDFKGKRVGNVLALFGAPTVALTVGGRLVLLSIGVNTFTGAGSGTEGPIPLVFQSSICAGTPFVDSFGSFGGPPIAGPFMTPFTLMNGTKLYILDGPAQTFSSGSLREVDGTTCTPFVFESSFTPVKLFFDLSTQLQPPFRLGQSAGTP